ncbi:uncharacterized protein V1516DRAFT_678079 [Lipomyces oligophaga]|uniref:uncharacterized protein n=1 Tax=Lipomyces oligophaga TaxID=45792 RepID=UPI0034CFCFBC
MVGGGPIPIGGKYSLRSTGVWEKIRKLLALVPNRSTGNPIVPLYRVPAPGSQPVASSYTDPSTLPAADIADNWYYKRDVRRAYPRTSSFGQADIAGLITFGSVAKPLVPKSEEAVTSLAKIQDGSNNLSAVLAAMPAAKVHSGILSSEGLPPFPARLTDKASWKIISEEEGGIYSDKYPVRTFQ